MLMSIPELFDLAVACHYCPSEKMLTAFFGLSRSRVTCPRNLRNCRKHNKVGHLIPPAVSVAQGDISHGGSVQRIPNTGVFR